MSLISVRNLAVPFTNKVHLITILLVAFVFAAWRWSGGGVSTRGAAAGVATEQRRTEMAPRAPVDRSLVEGMLPKDRSSPREERDSAQFADIERELGLR